MSKPTWGLLWYAGCQLDNYLYCISEQETFIMRIELNTGEVSYPIKPDGFELGDFRPGKMLCYKNNIYGFEYNGQRIMKYDRTKNFCEYIQLEYNEYPETGRYAGVYVHDDYIYIIPSLRKEIIIFDTREKKKRNISIFSNNISTKFNVENNEKIFFKTCEDSDSIWIFTQRENIAICLNKQTAEYIEFILPNVIKGCKQLWNEGNLFYIWDTSGSIYEWDCKANKAQLIWHDELGENADFGIITVVDDRLWILPMWSEKIRFIELETLKMNEWEDYPCNLNYCSDYPLGKYLEWYDTEGERYASMHAGNYILCIEKKKNVIRWIRPDVLDYSTKWEYRQEKGLVSESDYYSLPQFITEV